MKMLYWELSLHRRSWEHGFGERSCTEVDYLKAAELVVIEMSPTMEVY
jgi:hypothetical protein